MAKFVIKSTWYSTSFKNFLRQTKRYQVLYGGRGSGKTHHIIVKLIVLSFATNYNHILYVNQVFRHIKKAQFADIQKVIKSLGLQGFFKINKTDYSIENIISGTKFTAVGMDEIENTKGISDPTVIWWDEINRGTEEGFVKLNALLRTPLNTQHQFIISFNPVSAKHWLRSFFFSENNPHQLHERFEDSYSMRSTYLDNDFIDKQKYLDTLRQSSFGDINRAVVDIEGDWGSEENSNPYFYAYDESKMLSNEPLQYLPNYELLLSFDFNIDPATCVVAQIQQGAFIRVLRAYKINNCTLKELLTRIKADYPYAVFRVTGDPAGNSRNQGYNSANETMYSIIREGLNISRTQVDKPRINYAGENAQREIRIFCNSVLQNHPHIQFDKVGTEDLRSDIRIATTEEGKDKMYKTSGNTEFGMHLSDCFVYLLMTYCNDFIKN